MVVEREYMPDLATLTIYAMESGDGKSNGQFLTFDKSKAIEYASKHDASVVAHKYNWIESEVVWDQDVDPDPDEAPDVEPEPEQEPVSSEEAIQLYKDGAGLGETAKNLGMTIPKAREVLVGAGVTIRGRGRPKRN